MKLVIVSSAGLLALAAAAHSAAAQAPVAIPELHGEVLTGSPVDLPQGLTGKSGVLVVGFSQAARDEVTAWGKRLAGQYRDSPDVVYYEMPVLAGVPKFLRGWVLKKVTEGVPDRAKGRFLPVFDHEADWKAAAGFVRADDAYVIVVDSAGKVVWRTAGSVDDLHFDELKRRLPQ